MNLSNKEKLAKICGWTSAEVRGDVYFFPLFDMQPQIPCADFRPDLDWELALRLLKDSSYANFVCLRFNDRLEAWELWSFVNLNVGRKLGADRSVAKLVCDYLLEKAQ